VLFTDLAGAAEQCDVKVAKRLLCPRAGTQRESKVHLCVLLSSCHTLTVLSYLVIMWQVMFCQPAFCLLSTCALVLRQSPFYLLQTSFLSTKYI
jgi:hypothetical protein